MKNEIKILLMLMASQFELDAQNRPPTDHQFSYEIENQLAKGEMRSPTASYYYTFIGDYHSAITTYDIPISWGLDTIQADGYKTAAAISRIIKLAKDKNLVIISESHLKPQHRIFAKRVIDSLANYGYSHLGIEALTPELSFPTQLLDSNLNQRGYTLFAESGFFAREPQMAELIRDALKNNYQIFGYEKQQSIPDKDRDEIQADNVIRYLNNNRGQKTILLCGWHHAIESDELKRGRSYWMAKYLKDKTEIDPLTIYQDNFTEKVIYNEHELLDNIRAIEPVILLDRDGKVARLSNQVDIEVIYPKTKYINGRPNWLYKDNSYKEYTLDKEWVKIEYPLFFMAFYPEEQYDGTPVDIIEMKDRYDQRSLILKPGSYIIKVYNKIDSQEMELSIE